MNWKRFRLITLPNFLWYATGQFIASGIYNFWWVRIAKKQQKWRDADQEGCGNRFCRYCGKGAITRK